MTKKNHHIILEEKETSINTKLRKKRLEILVRRVSIVRVYLKKKHF